MHTLTAFPAAIVIEDKKPEVAVEAVEAMENYPTRRGNHHVGTSRSASQKLQDTPAQAKWHSGVNPDATINLPCSIDTFKRDAANHPHLRELCGGSLPDTNSNIFKDLSRHTEAYVTAPFHLEQIVLVWGNPRQVWASITILNSLTSKLVGTRVRVGGDWIKMRPIRAIDERLARIAAQRQAKLEDLRKEPENPGTAWESLGNQLELLDGLREQYKVHLYPCDPKTQIIGMSGTRSVGETWQIARHIERIWREISGKVDRVKFYMLNPPELYHMRENAIHLNNSQFATAFFDGDVVPRERQEQVNMDITRAQQRIDTCLLERTWQALISTQQLRGDLQIRVNFGHLVLERYKFPSDGGPSYPIDEFRRVVEHEGIQGRLLPGYVVHISRSDTRTNQNLFVDTGSNSETRHSEASRSHRGVGSSHKKVRFNQQANVVRFVEKAAVEFGIKETPYFIQLIRLDEYKRVGTKPANWALEPVTYWAVSLLDPNWKDFLKEESDLRDGKRFWNFIEVVEAVAAFLGPSREAHIPVPTEPPRQPLVDMDLGTLF
ncbi:hypothetical protein NUU61_006685 [Penicillium alfredii]|uniref:DUF7905 domain-containing protein n=1 Tax=Penicillium alfredii TaxID=1506179 RepID=A0A9W9K3V1_9EURO|nr:uncharacterized protein NUU61_006685 [Penicillium alfredii]KAJ5091815.1 hypothetical protein NUU61_006685 [Penicillium alfredii]